VWTLDLKSKIRKIPDFKGVVFWDITTLLKDKNAFKESIKRIADQYREKHIDCVVSTEARGFILGAALAYELGVGFVPIRKMGKLPSEIIQITYKKEYEEDTLEMHTDAIEFDEKVLLFDDVLATGGTIKANADLIEKLGGKVVGMSFLLELEYLNGRKNLERFDIFSLLKFESPDE
jgi:adenine phosphoribosyltransferase